MSASAELQKAVYVQLNGQLGGATVKSIGALPQNIEGGFVLVGDTTMVADDATEQLGFQATITIHSWYNLSDSEGLLPVLNLMGLIYNRLNRVQLVVSGYTLVDIFNEFEQAMIDSDDITAHGIQRFRAILTTQ